MRDQGKWIAPVLKKGWIAKETLDKPTVPGPDDGQQNGYAFGKRPRS